MKVTDKIDISKLSQETAENLVNIKNPIVANLVTIGFDDRDQLYDIVKSFGFDGSKELFNFIYSMGWVIPDSPGSRFMYNRKRTISPSVVINTFSNAEGMAERFMVVFNKLGYTAKDLMEHCALLGKDLSNFSYSYNLEQNKTKKLINTTVHVIIQSGCFDYILGNQDKPAIMDTDSKWLINDSKFDENVVKYLAHFNIFTVEDLESWIKRVGTAGVYKFLSFSKTPITVKNKMIEQLIDLGYLTEENPETTDQSQTYEKMLREYVDITYKGIVEIKSCADISQIEKFITNSLGDKSRYEYFVAGVIYEKYNQDNQLATEYQEKFKSLFNLNNN